MLERRVLVTNRLGLHARAAARLVRAASAYQSTIKLARVDGSVAADAKSILSVLVLAAARGTELVLTVAGVDEDAAMAAVCELFERKLGEERD